jgi:predicted CXXCH cytochrome family protein
MVVRRLTFVAVAVAALALVLALPSLAFANAAVHGSYSMSTDACAGCHRAHTAVSPITWSYTNPATGLTGSGSALLLSFAPDTEAFCYTCHGNAVLGADTNVFDGIYEARGGYGTGESGPLNGGGFDPAQFGTQHNNDTSWVAFGGGPTGLRVDDPNDPLNIGASGGLFVDLSCTVCHDVHGSSNYRLLKDKVNGVQVGGYLDEGDPQNPTPTPWVISAEPGYPGAGWLLHEPGAVQVAGYTPSYTVPMYAKAPSGDVTKGISAWCAACHTQYNTGAVGIGKSSVYDANDGYGFATRHRHPVNVPLTNYMGPRDLVVAGNPLPLAHSVADVGTQDASDWLDCLTCHVSHGSNAIMTGFANVSMAETYDTPWGTEEPIIEADTGSGGVPPATGNALLRGNNRYVCEACHNK